MKIFSTYIKKLIRHILPALNPYNFCMKQFFIRRVIKKLFQLCELRESPCITRDISRQVLPLFLQQSLLLLSVPNSRSFFTQAKPQSDGKRKRYQTVRKNSTNGATTQREAHYCVTSYTKSSFDSTRLDFDKNI